MKVVTFCFLSYDIELFYNSDGIICSMNRLLDYGLSLFTHVVLLRHGFHHHDKLCYDIWIKLLVMNADSLTEGRCSISVVHDLPKFRW